MNTQDVARELGTEPKVLRRFLRSPESTFQAVGSGGRYDFTEAEIPELRRRFGKWNAAQAQPTKPKRSPHTKATGTTRVQPSAKDQAVWAEEGDVVVPDVRVRSVRDQVRAIDNVRAARLDAMLIAAGQHLSQVNR